LICWKLGGSRLLSNMIHSGVCQTPLQPFVQTIVHRASIFSSRQSYKLFPMNFLFVKLNHHLLGTVAPSAYNLACNLIANSCLT